MDKDINISNTSSRSVVRFDKNIANNPDALALDFAGSDELVSSILLYAAWQHKNKLFEYGIIDPEDFAKRMGFQPNYLTNVHPNPACLEGLSAERIAELYRLQDEHPEDPQYRIFDSRFENALYLLVSKNLTFRRVGKKYVNKDGSSLQELQVQSLRLFKQFSIIFKKSKRGKKKIYYDYELDEVFSNNLSLFYVSADIEDFSRFRRKGLHKLYLYVKNLRETAIVSKQAYLTPAFDLLCQIAGINSSQPRDRKARLNKDFIQLKTALDIDLAWTNRPGERWLYVPIIKFHEVENMNNSNTLPSDKSDPIGEKIDIFTQNFMAAIISNYKEEFGYELGVSKNVAHLENIIMRYLKENERDNIVTWYMKAQLQTFAVCNSRSQQSFEEFYKQLPELKSYNDIKNCLLNIFQSQSAISRIPTTLEELKSKYKEVSYHEAPVTEEIRKNLAKQGIKLINIKGIYYQYKE